MMAMLLIICAWACSSLVVPELAIAVCISPSCFMTSGVSPVRSALTSSAPNSAKSNLN